MTFSAKVIHLFRKYDIFVGACGFPKIINYLFEKIICFEHMMFLFEKMNFQLKIIICFGNMICSFRNIIHSKKLIYLLLKYENLYQKIHLLVRNCVVLPSNQCGGPSYPVAGASICQEAWGVLGPNISAPGPKAPRAC